MSYAAEVKKELTGITVPVASAQAELAALMRINGVSTLGQQQAITIQTENAAIARRIYTLLKAVYQVTADVAVAHYNRVTPKKAYRVTLNEQVDAIVADLGIDLFGLTSAVPERLLNHPDKQRAFLRGAFLASGSVNSPERANYHLEIYARQSDLAECLLALLTQFHLPAKITERPQGYIVYLKRAEKIVDFLRLIDATHAMLRFEDIRMMRDMRNSVNRLVNAETANMQKTAVAANKQIAQIQRLAETVGLDALPSKLRVVAELRLAYPDESLGEIGQRISDDPISKSGVNHRMRKIMAFAAEQVPAADCD